MKHEIATRSSWKTLPLPETRVPLRFERSFSGEEHARIAGGLVPEQMEDKWFIFLEDDWLFLHRSWTGACIYAMRLHPEGEGSRVAEAWVSRESAQYKATDDDHDARLLGYLVDRLLLGLPASFPVSGDAGAQDGGVLRHHVVGYARANDEE